MYKGFKFKIISIFFIVGFAVGTYSQTQNILNTINQVEKLVLEEKNEDALKILNEASKSTNLSNEDLIEIYAEQSKILSILNNYKLAKKFSDLSVELSLKSSNKYSKAVALYSVAFLHRSLNNYEAMVNYSLQAIRIIDGYNEYNYLKSKLYYLIYLAYASWSNAEKMKYYAKKTIDYSISSRNYNMLSNGYNAISSSFQTEYNKTKNRKTLDSSYIYLNKSLQNALTNNKNVAKSTQAVTNINIANYILEFKANDWLEGFNEAKKYLDEAEKISLNNSGLEIKLAYVYGIKSEFALKQNDYKEAENYLNKSLKTIKKLKIPDYNTELKIYNTFVRLYEQKKDFENALQYQKKESDAHIKVLDQMQIFNTEKIEIQYEIEKKDQELQILSQKEKNKRLIIYFLSGFIILIGIIGFLKKQSYQYKIKYSKEKEMKLASEQEEYKMFIKLQQEEQNRLKAEQELLELQQQQLRKEVMANTLHIERKNDTLLKIQSKISDGNSQEIKNLIREEYLLDADFEETKMKIQNLHPDFFKILKRKALQKLTPLDMKYCSYIHLQLSTKQIAQILHIEPKSVRMSKYRIKQKFGLGKDVDIYEFMETIFIE